MDNIVNILSESLWKVACIAALVYILVAMLAMGWKLIEMKLLSIIDRKILERKQKKEENSQAQYNIEIFESRQGEWTATGWYREDESDLWQLPDYIKQESRDKWQWDEEKRIWIDLEKKARLERYRAYRESEGKGPTYEEWKAAKMKEAEHPEE